MFSKLITVSHSKLITVTVAKHITGFYSKLLDINTGTFACFNAIAPGIVVGMLQHDKCIEFSWHNDLKVKLEFQEG